MSTTVTQRGFTLVEILLVITLISAIGVATSTVDIGVVNTMRVHRDAESVLLLIRDAQSDAVYGRYGSDTGVRVETDSAIAYAGTSFEMRDTNHDRHVTISTSLDTELPFEIQFASHSGETDTRAELHFTGRTIERVLVVETSGLAYLTP